MKKIILLIVISASLILLSSCSSEPDGPRGFKLDTGSSYKEVLHKLKNYSLSLELVSKKRSFKAGEEAVVTFKLTNTGKKEVIIYEWMMKEEDNIGLYYMPSSQQVKSFDEKAWNGEVPEIVAKPKRSVLTLNPHNAAFIDKKLKFIKNMTPGSIPGQEEKYMIVGKLNLATVSAASPIAIITVSR
ncbi:MAG: hypothetical protein PHT27_08085 [Candidatus Izemoplasmatales bacterium]|nr:hypothetical protein [Candidatus Izemoplasmatales bacterium]